MRLILTRHGETELNEKKLMQGHIDGKLNDLGKSQIKKLALRLKHEKIDVIYTSDLSRALDTAYEVNNYHNVDLHSMKELRERDLGEFEGVERDKIWKQGEPFPQPKDGEDDAQLKARAKNIIDMVYQKHKDDNVCIVGHAGINIALLSVLLKKSFEDIINMGRMANTSVSILDVNDNENKLLLLNCAQHLSS